MTPASALTLSAGVSVRLDERTTATVESTGRLTMARGAVYVDTGASAASEGFVVRTPLGDVRPRHQRLKESNRIDAS